MKKKTDKTSPRIALAKETVRRLTMGDLSHVNAGCDTTSLTTESPRGAATPTK